MRDRPVTRCRWRAENALDDTVGRNECRVAGHLDAFFRCDAHISAATRLVCGSIRRWSRTIAPEWRSRRWTARQLSTILHRAAAVRADIEGVAGQLKGAVAIILRHGL